jgi:retron-type reverse transcriptase
MVKWIHWFNFFLWFLIKNGFDNTFKKTVLKKSDKKILKRTVRYIFFITGDLEKDIFFFLYRKINKVAILF